MKDMLPVVVMFGLGCALGLSHSVPVDAVPEGLGMILLYVLVAQVGLSIGSDDSLKDILRGMRPKMLLLPLATVAGTLLFAVPAGWFFEERSLPDCLAVSSGFAYYSLSSVLITELKSASAGAQVAAELATLALLTNVVREIMALLLVPVLPRIFGRMAPISAAGAGSMDVMLPSISRYSGNDMVPAAIMHGMTLEMAVPLLVTLFCSL